MPIRLTKRIRIMESRPTLHPDAVQWVSDLVLDLKLQILISHASPPITSERLNEWDQIYCPELKRRGTGGIKD